MLNKFILILSPFLFASCVSLSTIEIQVLEPASEPLVPEISSAILLNRTIIDEEEQEKYEDSHFPHNDIALFNKASTEIVFALADILNESPGMDLIDEDQLLEISEDKLVRDPEPLEAEFIVYICDSLNTNAVLSLEFLSMELPDEIKLTRRSSENYTRDFYTGEISLKINALWRAYRRYDGGIQDEHLWLDTLVWQHASFIANEIPDYLPRPEEATMEGAYYTALSYARRISPYWIVQERNYFSRGNLKLRRASDFIRSDQFENAEKIYEDLLERRNKNVVAAAAFNLAFINEIRGDYRQALLWARRSYKYHRHSVTADYIEILEERFEKSAELDEQLGR